MAMAIARTMKTTMTKRCCLFYRCMSSKPLWSSSSVKQQQQQQEPPPSPSPYATFDPYDSSTVSDIDIAYMKSQQLVMGLNGLELLWYNFTSDPDATARTKALGAISALIQNNKPGITAFRESNGYAALRDALSTESAWFQREALNLIQYLLHENSSDCNTVTDLGLPRIMMHLASSDDAEVRVATLRGLLVLARHEDGNSGQLVKNDDKLKQVLQELIRRISAMIPENLVAASEETQLVDSLWNACYNEPSSLGEKGLLVLPGKDAPARDVTSKLFEPPPSALVAAKITDLNHHQVLWLLRKLLIETLFMKRTARIQPKHIITLL